MPTLKDIENLLPYSHSRVCSRILLCISLLFIIILFNPALSYGRLPPIDPRDPYIRKILTLDTEFTFETRSFGNRGYRSDRSWRFNETYLIKTSGNIIDPRFMIYDAYTNYYASQSSDNTDRDSISLGASTTILRKFKFPTTIYEGRSYRTNQVDDSFGIRTFLKFRKLPKTTISTDWNRSQSDKDITITSKHALSMEKEIAMTQNKFSAEYSINDNDTRSTRFGLLNSIKLSRVSSIHSALSQYDTRSGDISIKKKRGLGYTMSLRSKTSKNFYQSHRLALYRSEESTGGSNFNVSGQNYAGSWRFNLLRDMNTFGGIYYTKVKISAPSDNSEHENIHGNWTLLYNISKGLTLSSLSSYSKEKSTVVDLTSGDSFSESFSTALAVGYTKRIKTVSFTTHYSFGYIEYLALPNSGGGTGITQSFSTSISEGRSKGILYKRIYFRPSYRVSRTDNITGNVWSVSKRAAITAVPKYWENYVTLNSSYSYTTTNDWRELGNTTTETLNLYGNSKTIKRFTGYANYSLTRRKISYLSDFTDNKSATIVTLKYGNIIFRGRLSTSVSIKYNKDESNSFTKRYSYIQLTTHYTRALFRRIRWTSTLNASRYQNLVSNFKSDGLNFTNVFAYSLRAWRVNANHQLLANKSQDGTWAYEEKLMITLRRFFRRRF